MARMFVVSQRSVLRGVFSQKKKLWDEMGFADKDLKVAVNSTRISDLNYSKLCKYISERGILQIYDPDEAEEAMEFKEDIDTVRPKYMIWELETNTYYDPQLPFDDEEEDEAEEEEGEENSEKNREKFHI